MSLCTDIPPPSEKLGKKHMYLTQLTTRSAGWSAVSHLAQA